MYIAYIREDGYPRVSTISMMKADGIKTIFTSTAIDVLKTKRIQANPKVSMCFRNGYDNITLTGTVEISQDNRLREELWEDWCLQHFLKSFEQRVFPTFPAAAISSSEIFSI